jgi:hypothetical protein
VAASHAIQSTIYKLLTKAFDGFRGGQQLSGMPFQEQTAAGDRKFMLSVEVPKHSLKCFSVIYVTLTKLKSLLPRMMTPDDLIIQQGQRKKRP